MASAWRKGRHCLRLCERPGLQPSPEMLGWPQAATHTGSISLIS